MPEHLALKTYTEVGMEILAHHAQSWWRPSPALHHSHTDAVCVGKMKPMRRLHKLGICRSWRPCRVSVSAIMHHTWEKGASKQMKDTPTMIVWQATILASNGGTPLGQQGQFQRWCLELLGIQYHSVASALGDRKPASLEQPYPGMWDSDAGAEQSGRFTKGSLAILVQPPHHYTSTPLPICGRATDHESKAGTPWTLTKETKKEQQANQRLWVVGPNNVDEGPEQIQITTMGPGGCTKVTATLWVQAWMCISQYTPTIISIIFWIKRLNSKKSKLYINIWSCVQFQVISLIFAFKVAFFGISACELECNKKHLTPDKDGIFSIPAFWKAPHVFTHFVFKNGVCMLCNIAAPFSNATRAPFERTDSLPISALFAWPPIPQTPFFVFLAKTAPGQPPPNTTTG